MAAHAKHYRFIKLFLNGPEGVRGNWSAAAREAGFKERPSRKNPILMRLLEEAGRSTTALETMGPMPAEDDAEGWKVLAERVKPIMRDAALGLVALDPQQRMVIKEIIDRAEGKVGQQKADTTQGPYVVVLPTLGSGKGLALCDDCVKRLGGLVVPTASPQTVASA